MAEENDPKINLGPIKLSQTSAFILAAILAGGGSGGIFSLLQEHRPDPFTGTEAKHLEHRLRERIEGEANARSAADAQLSLRLSNIERRHEVMDNELALLNKEMSDHRAVAAKYINIIERNTEIILENQRKAHTHSK